MKKIFATIIKEWQLMRRDVSGILLLLVMPAALIVVMALVQDAPFKDYQELRFDLLLADSDHGSFARQITEGLKRSKNFRVVDTLDGAPITEDKLKLVLNKGDYKIGVAIPAGITAEIVNATNIVVNNISVKIGMESTLPARERREQMYVRIYFDPVSKPAFRTAISSALEKYITFASTDVLMQRLSLLHKDPKPTNDSNKPTDLKKIMQGIEVKEEPLNDKGKYTQHMNSVQHNVPAWAIFGMFFIIIPIAGHIIKEREDGSAIRVGLIPNAHSYVTMGKIIFYTLVCSLQFIAMLCIGFWVIPLFHLPALYPGLNAWLLLPVSLCIGFAATAYGFFVGTIFKTINQALPFGSVSIVILSALGGIWVPIEILPPAMQRIAMVSPLHWSLEAVNQVILRNGGIRDVAFPLLLLVVTGFVCWIASMLINRNRFTQ
jgi:ABC-2 type transport system permease protein